MTLMPTGDIEGTYGRVGMAIREDCAWYGYLCVRKEDAIRKVTSPREWENGSFIGEYLWETAYRKVWWDDLEHYKVHCGVQPAAGERWKHEHDYECDEQPDMKMYKTGTHVKEKVVVVV